MCSHLLLPHTQTYKYVYTHTPHIHCICICTYLYISCIIYIHINIKNANNNKNPLTFLVVGWHQNTNHSLHQPETSSLMSKVQDLILPYYFMTMRRLLIMSKSVFHRQISESCSNSLALPPWLSIYFEFNYTKSYFQNNIKNDIAIKKKKGVSG